MLAVASAEELLMVVQIAIGLAFLMSCGTEPVLRPVPATCRPADDLWDAAEAGQAAAVHFWTRMATTTPAGDPGKALKRDSVRAG